MMQERGVFVDHSTVHRWAIKVLPVLAALFRKRKRPAGSSWRMDETYIKAAFLGHTSITRRNQIWRVRIMITI
jgi:transposase-like protein